MMDVDVEDSSSSSSMTALRRLRAAAAADAALLLGINNLEAAVECLEEDVVEEVVASVASRNLPLFISL